MTRQKVDVIPASVRSVQNGGQLKSQTNIRVAAYCRVSTGDESQQTSYTTQKAFYKDLITRKPGWIFAGFSCRSSRVQVRESMVFRANREMDFVTM